MSLPNQTNKVSTQNPLPPPLTIRKGRVIFTIFEELNLFCDRKLFNIFLGLYIYFVLKPVKMIPENHSLT